MQVRNFAHEFYQQVIKHMDTNMKETKADLKRQLERAEEVMQALRMSETDWLHQRAALTSEIRTLTKTIAVLSAKLT